MNLNYIKWKVGYADGFEIEEDYFLKTPFGITYNLRFLDTQSEGFTKGVIPLLLQRARSGWNKAHKSITHFIDMNKEYIEFNCDIVNPPLYWYKNYPSEDEALESTLKYIYIQEKNK